MWTGVGLAPHQCRTLPRLPHLRVLERVLNQLADVGQHCLDATQVRIGDGLGS